MISAWVHYTPHSYEAVSPERWERHTAVVIDILRATTSMIYACAHGCPVIRACQKVEDARRLAAAHRARLAGERQGFPPAGFDAGNRPSEHCHGRWPEGGMVMTTTNGTRALMACRQARITLALSFGNLTATAIYARRLGLPMHILAAGTHDRAGLEDLIAAGAFLDAMGLSHPLVGLWREARLDLPRALTRTENGRRLNSLGWVQDIEDAARLDICRLVLRATESASDPPCRELRPLPLEEHSQQNNENRK